MNVLQDPASKTSINSLLNPQDGASFQSHLTPITANAISENAEHSQGQLALDYGHGYGHGNASYSLRTAATWDHQALGKQPRQTNYQDQHRAYPPYQQPTMGHTLTPPTYPERNPTLSEGGSERPQSEYGDSVHGWQRSPQASAGVAYNGHPSSVQYSHDHTISGDYKSDNLSLNYREHSDPPQGQVWQVSERASVRLAARGTTPDPSRYSQSPPLLGHHNGYVQSNLSFSPQQIISLPVSAGLQPNPGPDRTATKRPLPDHESNPAPKAKKVKDKGKSMSANQSSASGSTGTSRRGYNAKKRQEAATIAAQNATAYHRAQTSEGELGTSSGAHPPVSIKFIPELQFARCMSNRYRNEEFTRCVSCTRRWAGDTCRFQGIRYFIRDQEKKLMGVSFKERAGPNEATKMEYPKKWNRRISREHTRRSKLSIAKALLPVLKLERQHISHQEIIRRPRETDVRVTCDTCMTSLFSTSFMCRLCGRELCHECFSTVKELTHEPSGASLSDKQRIHRMREKHVNANPFFLSCLKRNEHGFSDFTPVSRFQNLELDQAINEMEKILEDEQASHNSPNLSSPSAQPTTMAYSEYLETSPSSFPQPLTTPVIDDYTPANLGKHITSVPVYRAQTIPASLYDPPASSSPHTPTLIFSELWSQGLPLLVKDVLPRFKLNWTPEYFQKQYGDSSCLIVECQTDVNRKVDVKDFFGWFGQYEDRQECWKLKDWPPTAEFKNAFPELFEDFTNAVPVPDYVRRDGVYNIGSHFPSNAIGPDLGPKMYNSMATSQEPGSKGSTRLHMDMADALNVMLFSSPCPDGSPGYAVWDLFRADDSDKIRAFIRKKFAPGNSVNTASKTQSSAEKALALQAQQMAIHDPIHSQQFYLDVALRKELFEEHGVKSYRIYQRPGDGVFIPAGCAHQVANAADCIKIAIDFVSPENIDRCEQLTKEFREQNQLKAWKEDVLQLRTMMWFAWQSCSIREKEFDDDDSALGGAAMAIS